jgi:uncharacterized protein (TIGR03435 family)
VHTNIYLRIAQPCAAPDQAKRSKIGGVSTEKDGKIALMRAITSFVICASFLVYGQSGIAPQFEVASIKLSAADSGATSGIRTGQGRLDAKNVTLLRCIMGAYGVGPHQISGGPVWLNSDRFEIYAKAGQPTNDDALFMELLRSLLAERFKLVLHRETRTASALVLEVARNGPKLVRAEPGEAGTNTSSTRTGVSIDAHNTGMDSFAKILARQTDLPVVNQTGLEGIYNLKLSWTTDNARPVDTGELPGPTLFTALQEQLGLRLRAAKAPVDLLVIDHVEKPSEN